MEKQNAFITGAGRKEALGYNLVLRYLEAGYRVVASVRRESEALKELQKSYPDDLFIVLMDIGNTDSVNEAVKKAAEYVPCVDVLINNAVTVSPDVDKEFEDFDLDYIQDVVNVTSVGALRVIKALIPLLEKSKTMSLTANITSEAGSIGKCYRTKWFDYSMAKAALNMGTKLLANKYMDNEKLNFKCVHPGWIHTSEGSKDAPTEPYDGAETLRLLFEKNRYDKKGPVFITSTGEAYPW